MRPNHLVHVVAYT
ncbi:hypothetical protein F383_31323 [Gossypium arboreum]|uniref:Uncharacterized protein n=1 Tax=Gossypium arboreum TaxID=29729 RepID=A0A0B0PIK2_GOSAR|nr:hypothetical protein F383_31323 [Gossypium arboreum]